MGSDPRSMTPMFFFRLVGVNALNGLIPISTLEDHPILWGPQYVSMPSTGLFPFLQAILRDRKNLDAVSMPSTGLFPFLLLHSTEGYVNSVNRVNALNGLTSISTHCWRLSQSTCHWSVSMPSTGLLPFLLIADAHIYDRHVCQCPQRAYFHFYGSLSEPLILLASESYFYK